MKRLEQTLSRALENLNGDNYLLAVIIGKRSEQLANGEENLIPEIVEQLQLTKPADIALHELAEDKLDFKII